MMQACNACFQVKECVRGLCRDCREAGKNILKGVKPRKAKKELM